MDIKVNGHEYFYDVTSMSMLFFPGEKTNYVKRSLADTHIISSLKIINGKYVSSTRIKYHTKWYSSVKTRNLDCDVKNLVKQTFYIACSKATGITSPWGILTGIRPLSVYMRHLVESDNIDNIMKNEYFLSYSKIAILHEVYDNEVGYFEDDKNAVSIYISIPFCPSKCSYCSFVSVAATGKNCLLDEYLINLYKEIKQKSQLIKKYALKIKSLYIGGGTPGVLNEVQLNNLLSTVNREFDLSSINEISFELGRPETVTPDKLRILKEYGVNRICINTQSTNDNVLSYIKRNHTSSDYFKAIETVREFGFDAVNTDIIAGLPGESYDSFCKTVDDIIVTGVNNITVHTLAIKRAADLSGNDDNYAPLKHSVTMMLDYAYRSLKNAGYSPYYIYRQKNCVSNGENIGFCKNGYQCGYNIYMMEDVHSIISCGAGASTKIIDGTKVSRVKNIKYPMEYNKFFDRIKVNTQKTDDLLKEIIK